MRTTIQQHGVLVRILLDTALVATSLFGPWVLLGIVGLLLIIFYGGYEAVLVGAVFDALHASGGDALFGVEYPMTVFFLLLSAVAILVRRRLALRSGSVTMS